MLGRRRIRSGCLVHGKHCQSQREIRVQVWTFPAAGSVAGGKLQEGKGETFHGPLERWERTPPPGLDRPRGKAGALDPDPSTPLTYSRFAVRRSSKDHSAAGPGQQVPVGLLLLLRSAACAPLPGTPRPRHCPVCPVQGGPQARLKKEGTGVEAIPRRSWSFRIVLFSTTEFWPGGTLPQPSGAREQSGRWPHPGGSGHRPRGRASGGWTTHAGRGVLCVRRHRPTEGLHEPKEISDT
ncbi:uncharacterized protein LOC109502552 isoform X2 [Felis catus]|uniref:uncharacterized protein LOC109502552 isoform X2 n=1 Tax=Felis catus TaxID=9685 RepID=UPI001D19F333|nr:uncharacterized protein LOC109502552 isoform X2 [Felis catus]